MTGVDLARAPGRRHGRRDPCRLARASRARVPRPIARPTTTWNGSRCTSVRSVTTRSSPRSRVASTSSPSSAPPTRRHRCSPRTGTPTGASRSGRRPARACTGSPSRRTEATPSTSTSTPPSMPCRSTCASDWRASWRFTRRAAATRRAGCTARTIARQGARWTSARPTPAQATQLHPIIRDHPETGRLGLFGCIGYVIGIDGMDDDEGRAADRRVVRLADP